jgi:hypothetical protein
MDQFEIKVKQFQTAMNKYNTGFFYQRTGLIVSIIVILLQFITLLNFYQKSPVINPLSLFFPLLIAYILTDFINGLVHMYMDNNTNYNSFFGPFIAAFHLHHLKPRYSTKHSLKIYFYESGTKFWLVIYLSVVAVIQQIYYLQVSINFCLVSIGILSSLAEVSHYWCHNSKNKNYIIQYLQKYRIILSKSHHVIHHLSDNTNYAFLNGASNPLINKIANYLYTGYKNHSDQHAKFYTGQQSNNRT